MPKIVVGILSFINRIKARKIYTKSPQNADAKQETFIMKMDANQEQSGSDLDNSFKFNFNISEKSSNELGKCDASHTEDGNEKEKGELSDSEKSKSETAECGASHVNNGSFFKMEKTDNAFRFQFDIEGKT